NLSRSRLKATVLAACSILALASSTPSTAAPVLTTVLRAAPLTTPTTTVTSTTTPPTPAAAAGYTLRTFATASNFNSSTVDMKMTTAAAFQWYFLNFFSTKASSTPITLHSAGTITLSSIVGSDGNNITSAAQISCAPYYRRTAFGGGGYFEATL